MGTCFSSTQPTSQLTAKLITLDGSVTEYSSQVQVLEVLGGSHPSCFVCKGDELYYGKCAAPLAAETVLQLGHIYFVLPVSKLKHALTVEDMVELAVKASAAIDVVQRRGRGRVGRRKMIRVMPVAEIGEFELVNEKSTDEWQALEEKRMTRSVSMKRKYVNRLKRGRLSTIEEVAE